MTTYNAQTDWKKIDWKKLSLFQREWYDTKHDWRWWMEKRRTAKCGFVRFAAKDTTGNGCTWTWTAGTATILFALVSFLHGKLHMTKKRIPYCDASGGTEVVPFTKEHQEELIGDLWKDFLLPETATAAPEAKAANG